MFAFFDEVLHVMDEHRFAALLLCAIFFFGGQAVEKFCSLFLDNKNK